MVKMVSSTLCIFYHIFFFLLIQLRLQCLYSLSFRKSGCSPRTPHLWPEMICYKFGRSRPHWLPDIKLGLTPIGKFYAPRPGGGLLSASVALWPRLLLLSAALTAQPVAVSHSLEVCFCSFEQCWRSLIYMLNSLRAWLISVIWLRAQSSWSNVSGLDFSQPGNS